MMKFRETLAQQEALPIMVHVAQPEDAVEIVKIQAETWLATYPNEEYGITAQDIQAKKLDDPLRVARWRLRLEDRDPSHRTWIAKEGLHIVGYCFAQTGEKENHVTALYVSPQEQHRGVGKRLMDEALIWFGTSKSVALEVATYNAKAIAFYEKYGFQKVDETPKLIPPLPSGKSIPIVKMVKRYGQALL